MMQKVLVRVGLKKKKYSSNMLEKLKKAGVRVREDSKRIGYILEKNDLYTHIDRIDLEFYPYPVPSGETKKEMCSCEDCGSEHEREVNVMRDPTDEEIKEQKKRWEERTNKYIDCLIKRFNETEWDETR